MTATTTTREHRQWLIDLLGAENLAKLRKPLTAAQSALVDEALAEHDGDPVAALGAEHLPADVQATIRRVTSGSAR